MVKLTVKEYSELKGITCLPTIYKQIHSGRLKTEKIFGKYIIILEDE